MVCVRKQPLLTPRLVTWVLLLTIVATQSVAGQSSFDVGLHFIDATLTLPELPQAEFVDGEWIVDYDYHPVNITASTSYAVSQGGLANWNETDVHNELRFRVEQIYRNVDLGDAAQTLNINFFNGAAPTSGSGRRLNVVIGSNLLAGSLLGWSQTNAAFNPTDYPNGSYAAAVFLDHLDALGAEEDVSFSTSDAALNNLAGTIAHEVGHWFGLDHEPAGAAPPYNLMAVGGTGLTNPMRLTERAFSESAGMQIAQTTSSVNRADFNYDGDVDVFQFPDRGDAQTLSRNLGLRQGASHFQGDANSDGDVDVFQIDGFGDAQMLASSLTADSPFAEATALYYPATGALQLTLSGAVGVVGLQSDRLLESPQAADLTELGDIQADGQIWALFNPTGLPTGLLDLGAILPTRLTSEEIRFAYTPLGAPTRFATVLVAPEPQATALALLGLLGTEFLRRHRPRKDALASASPAVACSGRWTCSKQGGGDAIVSPPRIV